MTLCIINRLEAHIKHIPCNADLVESKLNNWHPYHAVSGAPYLVLSYRAQAVTTKEINLLAKVEKGHTSIDLPGPAPTEIATQWRLQRDSLRRFIISGLARLGRNLGERLWWRERAIYGVACLLNSAREPLGAAPGCGGQRPRAKQNVQRSLTKCQRGSSLPSHQPTNMPFPGYRA